MPDLISWYVVELGRRLAPHMPAHVVQDVVAEAEAHLRETVQEILSSRGVEGAEAERLAISAFGSPAKVAKAHLRESDPRIWGLRPVWFVLVGALVSIWAWDFQWVTLRGYWDIFGESWMNGAAGILGVAGLIAFFVGCRRGKRSYSLHILALAAAFTILIPPLLSYWMISAPSGSAGWPAIEQGISRFHLIRDTASVRKTISDIDSLEAYFREGIGLFGGDHPSGQVPSAFRDLGMATSQWGVRDATAGYGWAPIEPGAIRPDQPVLVPYANGVFAEVDGRIWSLEWSDADHLSYYWRTRGPKALRAFESERLQFQQLLALSEQASQGRLFFWNPAVYAEAIDWTLLFLPFLLIGDVIVFAWTMSRRRPVVPGVA